MMSELVLFIDIRLNWMPYLPEVTIILLHERPHQPRVTSRHLIYFTQYERPKNSYDAE